MRSYACFSFFYARQWIALINYSFKETHFVKRYIFILCVLVRRPKMIQHVCIAPISFPLVMDEGNNEMWKIFTLDLDFNKRQKQFEFQHVIIISFWKSLTVCYPANLAVSLQRLRAGTRPTPPSRSFPAQYPVGVRGHRVRRTRNEGDAQFHHTAPKALLRRKEDKLLRETSLRKVFLFWGAKFYVCFGFADSCTAWCLDIFNSLHLHCQYHLD